MIVREWVSTKRTKLVHFSIEDAIKLYSFGGGAKSRRMIQIYGDWHVGTLQ